MKQSSESKTEKKQKAVLNAEQEKMKQLIECIGIASATPEGVIAFRQLMHMCAYNQSVVVVHPQTHKLDTVGSIYNAARENIWKEFRQLIPVKTRKKIEYEKTIFVEGGE